MHIHTHARMHTHTRTHTHIHTHMHTCMHTSTHAHTHTHTHTHKNTHRAFSYKDMWANMDLAIWHREIVGTNGRLAHTEQTVKLACSPSLQSQ